MVWDGKLVPLHHYRAPPHVATTVVVVLYVCTGTYFMLLGSTVLLGIPVSQWQIREGFSSSPVVTVVARVSSLGSS
jgi:hypothetical protein